jgi:hypothetical protein
MAGGALPTVTKGDGTKPATTTPRPQSPRQPSPRQPTTTTRPSSAKPPTTTTRPTPTSTGPTMSTTRPASARPTTSTSRPASAKPAMSKGYSTKPLGTSSKPPTVRATSPTNTGSPYKPGLSDRERFNEIIRRNADVIGELQPDLFDRCLKNTILNKPETSLKGLVPPSMSSRLSMVQVELSGSSPQPSPTKGLQATNPLIQSPCFCDQKCKSTK